MRRSQLYQSLVFESNRKPPDVQTIERKYLTFYSLYAALMPFWSRGVYVVWTRTTLRCCLYSLLSSFDSLWLERRERVKCQDEGGDRYVHVMLPCISCFTLYCYLLCQCFMSKRGFVSPVTDGLFVQVSSFVTNNFVELQGFKRVETLVWLVLLQLREDLFQPVWVCRSCYNRTILEIGT